jgi:magnesium chelatase family protein
MNNNIGSNGPVFGATLRGMDAVPVAVEVDLAPGLPAFTTVGLAEAAVRESRVRVQAAISNSGFYYPLARISLNLAPANVKKDGSGFDLPIALAILAAHGTISDRGTICLAIGELSLSGEVRPVRGALASAQAAALAGIKTVLVPPENGAEAALAEGVDVRTVRTLADAVTFLAVGDEARAPRAVRGAPPPPAPRPVDLADVRGQATARRALEIAAAGGHNLLFVGGPGTGKTMLARRLPTILPPLSHGEALEVTGVHSVAGLNIGGGLVTERPFRAPHHSTSAAGLVGGGSALPRPGEITLAHHGVLFLDELPEFARPALESLREPLESGEVLLSRASGTVRYPARCHVVASMNPCPCGRHGDVRRACRCNPHEVHRYQSRISGPLLDRIDMHVTVPSVDLVSLEDETPGEPSALVAARVRAARSRQQARFGTTNALAGQAQVLAAGRPDRAGRRVLARAVETHGLSARAYDRVMRVARTIADLAGDRDVCAEHVMEALLFRVAGIGGTPFAAPAAAPSASA